MGIIISKFRKKESSFQVLEKLEKKICEIESYSLETQKLQKRYAGNFIVGSLGVFIICFGVFYFFFFPPTWSERFIYSLPLLGVPVLIFIVRWILNFYFDRQLNKKSNELFSLRDKKRQTLENVMNNEPYKVALQILERFSDKSIPMKSKNSPATTPGSSPATSESRLMARHQETPHVRNVNYVSPYRPQMGNSSANLSTTPVRMVRTPATATPVPRTAPQTPVPTRPLNFPLIDWKNRGVVERMVDYLVGDGPSMRYAMICKFCFRHNGMALQEEFEYSNFVCAYCNQMNPARKLRPTATSLERNGRSGGVGVQAKTSEKTESSDETPSTKSSDNEDDPLFTPWKSQEEGSQEEQGAEADDGKDSEGGPSVSAEGEKDAEAKKVD